MTRRPLLSTDPDAALLTGKSDMAAWSPEDARFGRGAVLGVDPGLNVGWCVYHPAHKPQSGAILLRGDLGEALDQFAGWLRSMIQKHNPAIVAAERPFGNSKFTSPIATEVLGVLHMVAFRSAVARREFTASEIKKSATGSGRAGKAEVMAAVRDRYGIAAQSNHEADAAAVAVLAWAREAQR